MLKEGSISISAAAACFASARAQDKPAPLQDSGGLT